MTLFTLLIATVLRTNFAQESRPIQPVAITHVTLIDVAQNQAQADMTVVITGDRITSVGSADTARPPEGATLVDGRGKYLMPGLWDMHVHLVDAGESALPLFVANGVTSVRDMGGDFAQIQSWREQIAAGTLIGPRIKTSGPILESPRAIARYEQLMQVSQAYMRVGIASPEEVPQKLSRLKELGVDFLKTRTTASRATFLAIAAEARRLGLTLVGHAPSGLTLVEAADAGLKSIEHYLTVTGPNYTPDEWNEVAARFAAHGTHLCPTMISGRGFRLTPEETVEAVIADTAGASDPRRKYLSARLVAYWAKQLTLKRNEDLKLDYARIEQKNIEVFRNMHRTGVPLLAGTDVAAPMVFPGFSLHDELRMFVNDLGLSPAEALRSATQIPARFMGIADSLGAIEPGKLADVVLLDANPLEDIEHTRRVSAVFANGHYLSREALDRLLERVAATARNDAAAN